MNKLFALNQKSQFKTNKNLFILFFNVKYCKKICKNGSKITKNYQNAHYLTVFDNIQHYSILKGYSFRIPNK